jgi:hypothetical protein
MSTSPHSRNNEESTWDDIDLCASPIHNNMSTSPNHRLTLRVRISRALNRLSFYYSLAIFILLSLLVGAGVTLGIKKYREHSRHLYERSVVRKVIHDATELTLSQPFERRLLEDHILTMEEYVQYTHSYEATLKTLSQLEKKLDSCSDEEVVMVEGEYECVMNDYTKSVILPSMAKIQAHTKKVAEELKQVEKSIENMKSRR